MASLLITSFFKSVQPPESAPQTEQTSTPLVNNQTAQTTELLQSNEDVTSRKKKGKKKCKRSKQFNGHPTLPDGVESRGRVLLGDVIDSDLCDGVSSDVCEESVVLKSDVSQVVCLSPLKRSSVIILGHSPKSNRSSLEKRNQSKRRLLTFQPPAHPSDLTLVHVRQSSPCDGFLNPTASRLPQLSDTLTNYTPPCSGYGSLVVSKEKEKSDHHYLIVSVPQ